MPDTDRSTCLPTRDTLWDRLARVVAWSILISLALEGLALTARALGPGAPGWVQIAAESIQKLSWSVMVCAALAAAQNVKQRLSATMGLVGFCVAPLAVIVARALHKGTLQALGQDAGAPAPSVLVPAGIKALEYLLFGLWAARLSGARVAPLKHFLAAGAAIGLVGAGALALWKRPDAPTLFVDTINELFFPVGCAFVLHLSARAARLGRPA